jgi:hypothetical protein
MMDIPTMLPNPYGSTASAVEAPKNVLHGESSHIPSIWDGFNSPSVSASEKAMSAYKSATQMPGLASDISGSLAMPSVEENYEMLFASFQRLVSRLDAFFERLDAWQREPQREGPRNAFNMMFNQQLVSAKDITE